MNINTNYNTPSFGMAVKFGAGGGKRAANVFKNMPEKLERLMADQINNTSADIYVSEKGVSVLPKMDVAVKGNFPYRKGQELEVIGQAGQTSNYTYFPVILNDKDYHPLRVDYSLYEKLSDSHFDRYGQGNGRLFAIAEDIANDMAESVKLETLV